MYCESGIRHSYVAIMSVDTAKRPEKKPIKTKKNKKNNLVIFLIWYNSYRLAHRIAQCAAIPSLQGEGQGWGL